MDLHDVTFPSERLGLSLVLATDHRTKRKMIIVDDVRDHSPASGVLRWAGRKGFKVTSTWFKIERYGHGCQ